MIVIFKTVENSNSIIKGVSDDMVASIHEQMNDLDKQTITVTEHDEDTDIIFTNIFFKQNITKIVIYKEE